jgi:hypothetical protein
MIHPQSVHQVERPVDVCPFTHSSHSLTHLPASAFLSPNLHVPLDFPVGFPIASAFQSRSIAPMLRKCVIAAGMVLCTLYLLNPTFGFFELIPDNLPVIGNLDEGAAAALLLHLFRKWRDSSRIPPSPKPNQAPNVIDVTPPKPNP